MLGIAKGSVTVGVALGEGRCLSPGQDKQNGLDLPFLFRRQ